MTELKLNQLASFAASHGHEVFIENDHVMVRSTLWNSTTKERSYEWNAVYSMQELRTLLGY